MSSENRLEEEAVRIDATALDAAPHPHTAHADRLAQQMNAQREELIERVTRILRTDGVVQPLDGLYVSRGATPLRPMHSVLAPSLCIVAQGSKEFLLGQSRYLYDPFHYLLVTVDLPVVGQVIKASRERPYLGIRLELDPSVVRTVIAETHFALPPNAEDAQAIAVSALDEGLLGAIVRLARLLDTPEDMAILAPLITREIVYRLLMGAQGATLRHLSLLSGDHSHIARAVERIRREFDQPLRIEQLARDLAMSVSGFHHNFKAVTALSPLQYRKRLRLLEARRLLLAGDSDAVSAALRVGYHNASHFNRDYKAFFGLPPIRDTQRSRISTGV